MRIQKSGWLFATLLIVIGTVATARAQTVTVYNSIPKPLPGNVASVGFEALSASEFGDGLNLAAAGTFGQATVILSSWACQSGGVYTNDCVSAAGATFAHPITISLYSVSDVYSSVYGRLVAQPNALLAKITQTFNIPYRPSSDPVKCDPQTWFNKKDGVCYHGMATPISVNFSGLHIPTTSDARVIVSVTYNTSDYGPSPLRPQACNATAAGCPYDSLNVSADGSGPTGLTGGVGGTIDINGVYWNTSYAPFYCNTLAPGIFQLDTDPGSCSWVVNHPQIQVQVNTNATHHTKGSGL